MCEYCGCQSLSAVAELTREHDAVLGHVRTAREAARTGDAAAATAVCTVLVDLLGPHLAVEELALFPAMAREFPEHVDELRAEHAAVEEALREVAFARSAAPGWQARLVGALDVLRAHVRKEQDGLFPAALMTLTVEDWDEVDAVRLQVGSALSLPPLDASLRTALAPYDALVLAGGSARRLGGVDKPSLRVGERSLLDWVLAAVAAADSVIVVGPVRPTEREVRWTRETPPGGGPVVALAAGVALAEQPWTAVLAADLPLIEQDTVDRLRRAAVGHDGALLVDDEGQDQWLVGVWLAQALRTVLGAADDLSGSSLRCLLGGLDVARLRLQGQPWFDCDTPESLRRARELR